MTKWILVFLMPFCFAQTLKGEVPSIGRYFSNMCCYEPDPCCDPTLGRYLVNGCQHFGIEADALYWRTSRDDRVYAIAAPTAVHTFSVVSPENTWGWRVKAYLNLCQCYFIDAEYAHFDEVDQDTANNISFVTYFNGVVTTATARIETWYQRARARVGYYICQSKRGNVYAFGGASWLKLKEEDRLFNVVPGVSGLDQESQFNGAGFEAGIGASLRLFDCVGLAAECNGVGAIGVRKYDFVLNTDSFIAPLTINDYPNVTTCLPGLDMRLEAFYEMSFFCPMTLAVGYEYHHFFNAFLLNPLYNQPAFDLGAPSGGPDQVIQQWDIGFGGVYAALRFNF